jgi:hypothetical protein
MKKIFAGLLGLAALFAVGTITVVASREAKAVSVPASQVPTIALHWESLGVAAGAVITSPVFRGELWTECVVAADNSLGGSTRNILVDYLGLDGTTVLFRVTVPILTTARGLVGIGSVSQTASLPAGVTVIPTATGKRMQFTLSSAGAAAGSLSVTCR